MLNVTVNGTRQIKCSKGDNLYQVLASAGYIFTGNCGMKGRCERCRVFLKDTGSFVKSCQYIVDKDISVTLEQDRMKGITDYKDSLPPITSLKNNGNADADKNTDENADVNVGVKTDANTKAKANINADEKVNTDVKYGVAVDIGTTTIGMELVNLSNHRIESTFSKLNSQIAFGADVISRIQMAGDLEGMKQLRKLLFQDIEAGVDKMTADVPDAENHIIRYVLSGNAAMLSIAAGLTTENLFGYPFSLKNPDVVEIKPDDFIRHASFDVSCLKQAEADGTGMVFCLPNIAAFAGADVASGAVSVCLDRDSSYNRLIDLGTNGEIILCNKDGGVAASAACGSAFEGCFRSANVFGANIFDMLALLRKRKQLDENGILQEQYLQTGISIGGNIVIDMDIIQAFQLGKSAIISAIIMLAKERKISLEEIANVYISGGFGFHLNIENAVYLGLFPECFAKKTETVGNTSLKGAYLALIEPEFIDTINRFKRKITYIDLSNQKEFNDIFIRNLKLTGC